MMHATLEVHRKSGWQCHWTYREAAPLLNPIQEQHVPYLAAYPVNY